MSSSPKELTHPAAPVPTPEHHVLLSAALCARHAAARSELARLLEAGVDWDHLSESARWHGMTVLLAKHVIDHCPTSVPPPRLQKLQRLYRSASLTSMRRVAELVTILEMLRGVGIGALPMKGPVLAHVAYGDPGLRASYDHDILLAPQHAGEAVRLLLDAGYRPEFPLDSGRLNHLLRYECEVAFTAEDGRTPVEIHWRPVPARMACSLDVTRLLARSRGVEVLGQTVPWPRPDDLLLLLCAHGSKHRWELLEMLCAVTEVVWRNPDMDWPGLPAAAADVGCRRRLLLGALLAADILKAPVPEYLLGQARTDDAVAALAALAKARLFYPPPRLTLRDQLDWDIWSLDSPRAQAHYLRLRTLAPSAEDWSHLPLPPALHPLYYLTRPFRLGLKHGLRAITRHRPPALPVNQG